MTDRIKGLTVVLEQDVREDDIESTVEAIKHIKGVLDVKTVVSTSDDYFARARVRRELSAKLFQALDEATLL